MFFSSTINHTPVAPSTLGIKTERPECFTHDTHCAEVMQLLQSRQDLCDVVIIGHSGKRIAAHRLILMACSRYFCHVLSSPKGESQPREVVVNVDGHALEKLINYCYTGSLELSGDTIDDILITASYLRLTKVVKRCCEFVQRHLQPSNCLAIAFFAEQLNLNNLLYTRTIMCRNFEKLSHQPEFLLLSSKHLSEIIGSVDLRAPSQEFVFDVVKKWIHYDAGNRRKHFADLLAKVQLLQCSPSFLLKEVLPLCNTPKSHDLILNALKSHHVVGSDSTQQNKGSNRGTYIWAVYQKNVLNDDNLVITSYNLRTQKPPELYCTLPIKYRRHYSVLVIDNKLITMGGFFNSCLNRATSFDLSTMTLSELAPMQQARSGHRAAVLNGLIYAIGGWDGHETINSVERWDPAKRRWDFVASMNFCRLYFAVAVANSHLYVCGGYVDASRTKPLSSVECYDPFTNTWTSVAPMKVARFSHCLVPYKDLLYAVGGYYGDDCVECYDPSADTWTTSFCSLNMPRYTTCTSLNSSVYIYNNSKLYVVSSESTSKNLKLQLVFSISPDTLKNYTNFPDFFAMPYEFNAQKNAMRGKSL